MNKARIPSALTCLLATTTALLAVPVATDDGSTGTPFAVQNEDAVLDTGPLGLSVLTNDTGTGISFVATSILSTAGAPVTLNTDGSFLYDPRNIAAFQTLAAGASLEDTFSYDIVEPPVISGITEELNAGSGVNDRPWGTLPSVSAATGANRPALIGSAYQFTGTPATADDYQQSGGYNTTDVTLEFWITRDAVNTNEILWETGGAGQGSAILLNDDGTVTWAVKNNNNTTARAVLTGSTALVADQWYHIVATLDIDQSGTNDQLSLFINGVADGTDSTATEANGWSGSDDAAIGGLGASSVGADDANPGAFETNYGGFSGQLGFFNFYSATVFDATAALANYNAYANAVASTATVTVEITGLNDSPGALDDTAGSTAENATLVSTQDLLDNDGPTRTSEDDAAAIISFDAEKTAGTGTWENVGTLSSDTVAVLTLGSGVNLNSSVNSAYPGITAAYEFDGTSNATALLGNAVINMDIGSGDSFSNVTSAPDKDDASWEFWVKLDPADLTQIVTLFETGGGTGVGMVIDNGVLEAAVDLDGSTETQSFCSYSLTVDSLALLATPGDPTAEFFQVVYTSKLASNGGGSELYVNGILVDSSLEGISNNDWCGGDGAGVGHYAGNNHGGFQNTATGTPYDVYFNGSLAAFNIYNGALSGAQVLDNFELVSSDHLVLNYDARYEATASTWSNIGATSSDPITVFNMGTGITLNSSVTSTHNQITAAYEFDGTANAIGLFGSAVIDGDPSGDSINDVVGSPDLNDLSYEFWVKLDTADLSQISTLFETGGGTGSGVVIDNGVLKAGAELDAGSGVESACSYDLTTDSLNLLDTPGDPTTEFFQVVYTSRLANNGGGSALYINGVLVDTAIDGVGNNDWSGSDGAAIGHYAGNNHGGFANTTTGSLYDVYFNGSMAIFRAYTTALTGGQVLNNYNAISSDTDTEGDSYSVAGIFDSTGALQGLSSPATLPSGATVTLDATDGSFTYDPNGAYDSLNAGEMGTDTFTYAISDGNGGSGSASVALNITGVFGATDDALAASEEPATTFLASQLLANDNSPAATAGAYINLAPSGMGATEWTNTGTSGDTYTGNGIIVPGSELNTNFGGITQAYRDSHFEAVSLDAIGADDITFEIWFRPTPFSGGRQVLFEGGGAINGFAIIYDANENRVEAIADGGDDTTDVIIASAGGISGTEFNQLVVVYDKDASGLEDDLILYLNNDPASAFNSTPAATATNAGGSANDISGTDGSGIGRTNTGIARSENGVDFVGEIAALRIYDSILSTGDLSTNYDALRNTILNLEGGGSVFVTANGATVTLNADGSITYDGSALADLLPGVTLVDTFTYTISDGGAGTSTATATVTVTGVDEGFLAIDDGPIAIGEDDGPTAITVLTNDTQTGATVEIATVSSDFLDNFTSGTLVGDIADFTGTTGWEYLWNAPSDWNLANAPTASSDASTGGLNSLPDYEYLEWTGDQWTADGDANTDNNDPSGFLRLFSSGIGHPGLGSTQAGSTTIGNNKARAVIAAYSIPSNGDYAIGSSSISLPGNGGVDVLVYVDGTLISTTPTFGTETSFDTALGTLTAGQIVYVAASPQDVGSADAFSWDFSILKLPAAGMTPDNLRGSISTDGTTVTYTPDSDLDFIPVGESITETFQYHLTDGGSGSSFATVTVNITGANDAPVAIDDTGTTNEDSATSGNVLNNDTDPDVGEDLNLVVSAVTGGSVGSQFALPSGALLTLNADGSYNYDPNGSFEALAYGASSQDTFTYTAQDENGLDSAATATVTITINGRPDNEQTVATNTTQTINYAPAATNVPISPAIVVTDPNGGIASTIAPAYTVSTSNATPFAISPAPTTANGFAHSVSFTPVAADLAASTLVQVYEIGGNSNGNGIYLKDGIPYWVCKMDGDNPDAPSALDDTDWTGNTVSVPLSASVLDADIVHEISMIFNLDSLVFSLNGAAPTTVNLTNRSGQSNWLGGNTVNYGIPAVGTGDRGGMTTGTGGLFSATDVVALAGTINDGRFWNTVNVGNVLLDPETVTATLTINPAEGSFTTPAGSTYVSGVWTATGIPAQVTAALAAVEFQPNGTSPVNAAVDIRDGEEDGAVPVTGTVTFEALSLTILEQWRVANGFSADGSGLNEGDGDDFDLDTLDNLLEFGFGTDPTMGDNAPLVSDGTVNGTPTTSVSGSGAGITFDALFNRRDDFGTSGSVSYTVQFSGDLITFFDSTVPATIIQDSSDDPDYHVASIPYPTLLPNGQKASYYRVVVTVVP